MNLPTPKTALGKALERALLLALSVILTYLVNDVELAPVVYLVTKTALDFINSNVPNTGK